MSDLPPTTTAPARISWVDVAKGLGILLVVYGHFVERFILLGVPGAAAQMKWIYSFHMPLFFLLAGLVYKDRGMSLDAFVKRQVLTRLVPVWAFNLISMLVWIMTETARGPAGWVATHGWLALVWHCSLQTFYMVLQGRPVWNFLTWFVICLFVVELWQFALRTWVRQSRHLVLSIVGFAISVAALHYCREALIDVYGDAIHWWRIVAGLAAMVFYQLGILLRRVGWLEGIGSPVPRLVLTTTFLGITLLTFDRNRQMVLMAGADYGDVGWFFLASLAGTFLVIYLSQLLSAVRPLRYLGTITLPLMCLDGILHEFANPVLAGWVAGHVPRPDALLLTGICLVATALSIAVCIPVNWLIETYVPFMLGRKRSTTAVPAQSATLSGPDGAPNARTVTTEGGTAEGALPQLQPEPDGQDKLNQE